MSEWVQDITCPDPEHQEWHWTAPDNEFQLRVFSGYGLGYMMVRIDADGTRANYGYADSMEIEGAQRELMDKAGVGVPH